MCGFVIRTGLLLFSLYEITITYMKLKGYWIIRISSHKKGNVSILVRTVFRLTNKTAPYKSSIF